MWPELFRIPYLDLPINSFGVMLVIGLLAGMQLARFLAKRYGLDPEVFANAAVLAVVTGIIGARLSHVLENLGQYTRSDRSFFDNLWDAVNIRGGGLTYYGGFLIAFPTLVWYGRWKKVPIPLGMDIVAPCLMVSLALGRVGCFLNGCCYGATCDAPWAVRYPYHSIPYTEEFLDKKIAVPRELLHASSASGEVVRLLTPREIQTNPELVALARGQHSFWRHPAQLYSTITALLIAAVVLAFLGLRRPAGQGFALMMMTEGIARYVLELLRVEAPVAGHLSLSMLLGIALFGVGAVLWFVFGALNSQRIRAIPAAAS